MSVEVKVEGMDAFVKELQAIAKRASGAQLEAALRSGALLIQNSAIAKAPFDTGTLRRSISTETAHTRDGAIARVGVPNHSEDGTEMGYSIYQEFGTSKMRAHPYLRPAFDEERDNAVREIRDALKEMLRD
jgi:HK97 gp10 family phage protein